ncbi:TatD family hydrolase [Cohnella kolymensis]|uniref:TatD family hydrolase n=1 Tax=Cohnella kolymensis TaxID=1590652 RepID=UPI000AE2BA3B|nr:TatD family hydrolase [Cohnella kolymensis]
MFDTHIHLDLYESGERELMLESAFESGVDGVVSVSMGLESCRVNRELARRYSGNIMPAYGHHPEQPPLSDEGLTELIGWIREQGEEPFAIGEVGLPYYLLKEAEKKGERFDLEPYIRQLEQFVRLAGELDRPIVLHAVYEDAERAMELLERYSIRRAHFHWFKGSAAAVQRLVKAGAYISVTPDVLYEREIREMASSYPLERLMAETDGPWPFEGPFAGQKTQPTMVKAVLEEIALLRGMEVTTVTDLVNANSRTFYGMSRRGDDSTIHSRACATERDN